MFGRHPRLPVDLLFRRQGEEEENKSYTNYVSSLKKQLGYAYSLASASIAKSQKHSSAHYNKKIRGSCLKIRDQVLVRNVGGRGKHKIADRWEKEVFVVLGRPNPEIPFFEVKQENNKGRTRILHCNLLLPINNIPPVIPNEALDPVAVVQEVTEEGQVAASDEEDSVSIVSDESDIGQPVLRPRRQLKHSPAPVPVHDVQPDPEVQAIVDELVIVVQPMADLPATPEVVDPFIIVKNPVDDAPCC